MIGWIVFFFLSFSMVLLDKKIVQYLYPLLFWIFVGFRDNIGTDYPLTLESVERSIMPFSEISENFFGFNALDLEAVHKFIAMFMYSFDLPLRYFYVILAGIEALIIGYIIRKSNNYRFFLLFFICLYTINYPMNAARQGFSYILILLSIFIDIKHLGKRFSKLYSYIVALFAVGSHYGSAVVPIVFKLKINNAKFYIFLFAIIYVVVQYFGADMLQSRYAGTDETYAVTGPRLFLFAIVMLFTYKQVIKQSFKNQDIIIMLFLLLAIFFQHGFLRIYFMFINVFIFKMLMMVDDKKFSSNTAITLMIYPAMAFAFEILEICRTVPISGCGVWYPYSNWLF